MKLPNHQMSTLFSVVLLLLGFLVGCELLSPEDEIVFESTSRSYRPDSRIKLRLKNNSDDDVRYNLCYSELRVRAKSTWEQVLDPRGCDDDWKTLEPGEEDTHTISLPEAISDGWYRYENRIGVGGESRDVATSAFSVD